MVSIALSDSDISRALRAMGYKPNIVSNTMIHKYSSIDQLLGPEGYVIILYETAPQRGHWTLLMRDTRRSNVLEHCDSYGLPLDHEMKFIPDAFKQASQQDQPYLTQLILQSPYKTVVNNDFKIQAKSSDIQSCGRWCLVRLYFRDTNVDSFMTDIKKTAKMVGITPDRLVTIVSSYFVNK